MAKTAGNLADPNHSKSLATLQDEWRTLYTQTLPKAASARDPCQKQWPVSLDHCFARIILDAVSGDAPWMTKIKSPAYKNMSADQLGQAITLGERILSGDADLVQLDEQSLTLRGKKGKAEKTASATKAYTVRKKRSLPNESAAPSSKVQTTDTKKKVKIDLTLDDEHIDLTQEDSTEADDDRAELEAIIDGSEKTDFQKKCLKLLVQIPPGRVSTYAAMSKALSSAPRAVGNAMRNNPFAPRVPCHRIVASDRSIGGYGGDWGTEGMHYNKKLDLLKQEGVKFDSKGKVQGPFFEAFEPV